MGYGVVIMSSSTVNGVASPTLSLSGSGGSMLKTSVASTSPLALIISCVYGGLFSLNVEYTPSITKIS